MKGQATTSRTFYPLADRPLTGEGFPTKILARPDGWWALRYTVEFEDRRWILEPLHPPVGIWDRVAHSRLIQPWRISLTGELGRAIGSLEASPGMSNWMTATIGNDTAAIPQLRLSDDSFSWRGHRLRYVHGRLEEAGKGVVSFRGTRGWAIEATTHRGDLEDLAGAVAAGIVLANQIVSGGP